MKPRVTQDASVVQPAAVEQSATENVPLLAEVAVLGLTPAALVACVVLNVEASAALTLLVVAASIALMLLGYERSRPGLRQLMPTATLAGVAAAGRVLFAPLPYVKPVSAIAILAGAVLGRRSGFVVGALAALVSNFFFGQGPWTPWQMYSWGLVGYLAGVLPLGKGRSVYAWGVASGLMYGAILNGWYVVGFVRPLTWQGTLAAYAAGIPFDVMHGVATAGFLVLVWGRWRRALERVVAKYDM